MLLILCVHKIDLHKQDPTISSRPPFITTGSIWQKSPPNTITLPPNGFSSNNGSTTFIRSLNVLSTASNACLCVIGASSHIISFVTCKSKAKSELCFIEQVESSWILIGILKQEWAVRPPGKRSAAIPEEATARAISPFERTFSSKVLYYILINIYIYVINN